MTDVFAPGEFATFVKQGGKLNPCPSLRGAKRRGNLTFVCVLKYGGKAVTLDKYEGTPISVDREDQLPEEVKEIMGY